MKIVTFIDFYMWTFCAAGSLVVTNQLVYQTPIKLTVSEGGTAKLNCIVSINKIRDFVINWLREANNASNRTYIIYMNKSKVPRSFGLEFTVDQHLYRSQLSINNLQQGDSGTYYCELITLDPPSTSGINGNGSLLMITGPVYRKELLSWHYLLICFLVFVIIFIVVSFWEVKHKRLKVHSDSTPGTVLEDISGPGIYANMSSTTPAETRQIADSQDVYSDLVIAKPTNTFTEQVEYTTLRICKANPQTQSGDGKQESVVYSKLQPRGKI